MGASKGFYMNYDNTNTGVLFKNEKEHDKQPDYTGKINVEGVEKRLAGWIKDTAKGKILSLKVDDFREKQEAHTPGVAPSRDVVIEDIDDKPVDLSDIPF